MKARWAARHRRLAQLVGVLVLAALVWAVLAMLQRTPPIAAKLAPPAAPPPAAPVPELPLAVASPMGNARTGPTVRGVVRLPGGEPAEGAAVAVMRALTAWPEWQREELDRATTRRDGGFQFRFAEANGLLVVFSHPQFAGGLVELTHPGEPLELQLKPGFELFGLVTNEAGAPLAGARIALEPVPGDDRRVAVTTSAASGGYRFANLPAGPVRLVARHPDWQPASQPAVVIGDQRRIDIRCDRPAMAPLAGHVVSAVTGAPVAGAAVELLPLNGKLGLVDAIATRSGADGAFLLTGLPRGSMRLVVRHPEHGALMRTETVGLVKKDLQLELPRRSLVAGQLAVERGQPPWRGGETLLLRDVVGQITFVELGADGRFQCSQPLSPGWGSVRAVHDPFAFERSFTGEVDVRIDEAATTALDLGVRAPAVVRGRIVDENGEPLAGVEITRTRILAENARTIGDAAFTLDLTTMRTQVAQMFASERDELVGHTDKGGRFEIRGVKPGPLVVRASLRGRGTRLLRHGVTGFAQTMDLGQIPMARGCRLAGRVLRGGRPLAGASVWIEGADSQGALVTDASGGWVCDDLSPGGYRVRARVPSQPAGSPVQVVTLAPGQGVANLLLVLDAGRMVRGTVTGSNGQAIAGAIVSARGLLGSTVVTDSDGAFVLELTGRASELQVSLADRSLSTVVAVPPRDERLAIRLDTPPTCTLLAQVAGLPGRTPKTAALLRVTRPDDGVEATRSRWLELPDGVLRWPFCPTGRVLIEIQCDGHAPYVVERDLAANEEHTLGEVLLEPGCRLSGEVRAPDGSAIAEAAVMLGDESDLDLLEAGTRTAADGSFRLGGVTSRSRHVAVRAAGYAPRVVELVLPRDVLGKQPLRITLEPGATIEVSVPAAEAGEGAVVQLRRQGGRFVASAEVDENGRVWFANRSAGAYTVHLLGSDLPARPVVVESGNQVVRVRF